MAKFVRSIVLRSSMAIKYIKKSCNIIENIFFSLSVSEDKKKIEAKAEEERI